MKNLLKKLIQARSTAEIGESAAAHVLADYLTSNGIDCRVDKWGASRANLIAHVKSTGPKEALLFAAHLDVVPEGDSPWRVPAFDGLEQDGRIFGRGAADMKGGIAAVAAAIVDVVNNGPALKGDIIFAATAGEETDSCGTKRFVSQNSAGLPKPAGVIIPEPTDFKIVTAHRGMLWIKITTKGKTAHGSMPHLGINAITQMGELLNYLHDYQLPHTAHPLLGKCSMSINEIHGGKTVNIIPDQCSIKIDIRTLPGQFQKDIIENFKTIFQKLKTHNPQFKAMLSAIKAVPAMQTDNDSDFVKSFCRVTRIKQTNAVGFTTDGPFFTEMAGPVVIFGPGRPEVCHKVDEYIDIADLQRAKQYYKDIILELLT